MMLLLFALTGNLFRTPLRVYCYVSSGPIKSSLPTILGIAELEYIVAVDVLFFFCFFGKHKYKSVQIDKVKEVACGKKKKKSLHHRQ